MLKPPVAVVLVKYSHQIIKDIETLELVIPFIMERASEMEDITPTYSQYYLNDNYDYNDKSSALMALKRAVVDTIDGKNSLRGLLKYIRRLFLCSGMADNDNHFNELILLYYDIAMYVIANENENKSDVI